MKSNKIAFDIFYEYNEDRETAYKNSNNIQSNSTISNSIRILTYYIL